MNTIKILLAATAILWGVTLPAIAQETVADNKQVSFHYTLTVDGQEVESSRGQEPLTYVPGENQIIPGLEEALTGLKAGDVKVVVIEPEKGYGDIIQEGFREIPKETFPEDFEFQTGLLVEMQAADGTPVPAMIWEVGEDTVTLNFNHPLAGKTLTFDVEIVSVETPEAAQ